MKNLKIVVLLFLWCGYIVGQEVPEEEAIEHSEENSYCFSCHGSPNFSFFNEMTGKKVTKRMNPYLMIDSNLYYEQNHKSFLCIDCHSYDYNEFPHNNDLRFEELPGCLMCHEGDDATAQYHFEKINEEFLESVHSTRHSEEFTCWMCHNPHTYKINARNNKKISETVKYDNNICLSCHAHVNKYNLILDAKNPNVIKSHDWLPNQVSHFASVRCIECHARVSDNTLVAHEIQPKEKAVKKCVECHSKDATLLASLYKFQAKENRSKLGFFNSETLADSYIIGANRNYYLNLISGIFFGLVLLAVSIHTVLRILLK